MTVSETTDESRVQSALATRSRRAQVARLVLAAVLAAGLLAIATARLHDGSASSAGEIGAIQWHDATQVPVAWVFGPHFASAGDRLYMLGKDGTTEVWSSADGATWSLASQPATFPANFVPRAMSGDGGGGLVVVGENLEGDPNAPTQTPTVWHSFDGRTFTLAQVEAGTGAEIVSVAARPGELVAFGDHSALSTASGHFDGQIDYTLDAWHSADGTRWSHMDLPEATGYQALGVAGWQGGFAAVAEPTIGQDPAVWTSDDGRTWLKSAAALTDFGASSIVAFKDRLVILGAKDDGTDLVPASWSSVDGRNWVESTASGRDAATMIDAATVVGDTLVAVGSSHMVDGLVWGEPTMPPVGPENVWLSSDGTTWKLLPADTSLAPIEGLRPGLGTLWNRVVLASLGPSGTVMDVRLGDISG